MLSQIVCVVVISCRVRLRCHARPCVRAMDPMRITPFTLYSGLMLSISAFSIDILLPAMLDIAAGLEASLASVQLTISFYMIGLGLAHPVFGVLTDRVGRKPALYAGLTLYIIGALLVVLADTIGQVLAGRLMQGFGAAAAPVVCRAMIRDQFSGNDLARNMALASMFFAVGPMLAPLLGHGINAAFGWRMLFVFLFLFGTVLILATSRQPETLPPEKRSRSDLNSIMSDVSQVFLVPQSRYFILLSGVCTALIVLFLTHAPVIYETELGAGKGSFAFMFALAAIGIVIGQLVNHRLIEALGALQSAKYSALVLTVISALIMLLTWAGRMNPVSFTALMFVFNTCYLIVFSNFASLSLGPHAKRAGMAAAMFGLCSYLCGSLLAAAISFIIGPGMARWSVAFFFLASAILIGIMRWRIIDEHST